MSTSSTLSESGPDQNTGELNTWWISKKDLLKSIGKAHTPTYVYDEETIHKNVMELKANFIESGILRNIFFACKANDHPDILRMLDGLGVNFECVSLPEVEHIFRLFPGIDAHRILFTPNFAKRTEYARALELGVWLTLDNLYPLQHWAEMFRDREVLVRLDPGKGKGHHHKVITAGEASKFGVHVSEWPLLASLVASTGVRVVGLHAHLGSGILDEPQSWQETGEFLAKALELLPTVRILDLGGGIGVPYRPTQKRLDLAKVAELLRPFKEAHPTIDLWMEPGRYIVAESGVLLTQVTQTKRKSETVYVGVDAGMNSLIRPALYEAYHHIVNLNRVGEPAKWTADIVGPICETGDVLGHERRLPECFEEDVMCVCCAGAYGFSMSSFYNMRHAGKEILLKKEETAENVIARLQSQVVHH